jgi:hypothetical protein
MSTAHTVGYSLAVAVLTLLSAWHVVLLSRRQEPLWRAVVGWPGVPLRVTVVLLLLSVARLAGSGVGAWLGLAVAAAVLAWCIVTLLRGRTRRVR